MPGGRCGAPANGTRPGVGRSATTPLARAGTRSDPPRSLPSPSGAMPVATATASPPLDPPGVRAGSQGLRVAPCRLESVCQRSSRSGRLVRAITIAPAARNRATAGASAAATCPANARTPRVVGVPATSWFSLTVTGTPASGPSGAPAARARSSRPAAASASSASTRVAALTAGLTRSMRSRWAWTTSRALTCPERTNAASASADRPIRLPVQVSAMWFLPHHWLPWIRPGGHMAGAGRVRACPPPSDVQGR
jgi:hypothetical protein